MKPILFNTEMVRATLDNRKTVTRRLVKPQHLRVLSSPYHLEHPETPDKVLMERLCEPPYRSGDILYVRETWGDYSECQPGGVGYYIYRADYPDNAKTYDFDGHICDLPRWHPSIHMPREAARIFLRVTDVRVERLQDITDKQAEAEGIERRNVPVINAKDVFEYKIPGTSNVCTSAHGAFRHLWDSTIKPADRTLYGWDANPWVWVIEFERRKKPERENNNG